VRIGELARRARVSTKAIRYYERLGLLRPSRSANGYREYDESHLRVVTEIRELGTTGIMPGKAAPFVECLDHGREHGDDCMTSLTVYRDSIAELNLMIASLTARRDELVRRLDASASRTFDQETLMTDYSILPDNLPAPDDDGAADHLPGLALPSLTLPTSDGRTVGLGELGPGRTIIYLYPLTGRPGTDLPEGWDSIPGARGCSTEACDFRDHFEDLQHAGAARVFGLSSQSTAYQAEVVDRLRLPFAMLSDEQFALADTLGLPVFSAPGHDRLYKRLTLVIRDGLVEHVFYPIFPPNTHARQVLDWLTGNPAE
jgi:peroxiredoxin/DNA-binding transcriptional MerR regulator